MKNQKRNHTNPIIKKIPVQTKGFTLVELLVSVSITSLLMLGMSMFFSNTLRNLFQAQKENTSNQGHFVTNQILQEKFMNVEEVVQPEAFAPIQNNIVIRNKINKNELPFTYIGEDTANSKLVFKDFFVFSGIQIKDNKMIYGKAEIGKIIDKSETPEVAITTLKNFTGFIKIGNYYYVAFPAENKIIRYDKDSNDTELLIANLNYPIDIKASSDEKILYISNSKENEIIQYDINTSADTRIQGDFNFPTGLAYYNNTNEEYLFVADTYNNKIKKIDLKNSNKTTTIIGIGDNKQCNNSSALYCKLDFPTGLSADSTNHMLYIADTGNNRVLKMSDPGQPSNIDINLTQSTTGPIKQISFEFPVNTNIDLVNINSITSDSDVLNKNGEKNILGNTLTYRLWTTLQEDTITTNACTSTCSPSPCTPAPCTPTKNKLKINTPHNLFSSGTYNKLKLSDDGNNPFDIQAAGDENILLTSDFAGDHLNGDEVVLATDIPANSNISFSFENIDSSTTTTGFQKIKINTYDLSDNITSQNKTWRIGNNILGTSEDTIEIIANNLNLTTGMSVSDTNSNNVYFIDNLDPSNQNIKRYDGTINPINISLTPFPTTFTNFDYTSDFEITSLNFSKPNTNVLEAKIEAITEDGNETYTLNASLN